jgi:hypothetical protein
MSRTCAASAAAWQETLVVAGLSTVALAMLTAVVLLLWGTRRSAARR